MPVAFTSGKDKWLSVVRRGSACAFVKLMATWHHPSHNMLAKMGAGLISAQLGHLIGLMTDLKSVAAAETKRPKLDPRLCMSVTINSCGSNDPIEAMLAD